LQQRQDRSVVDVRLSGASPGAEAGFISVVREFHHHRCKGEAEQVTKYRWLQILNPGQDSKYLFFYPRAEKGHPAAETRWRLQRRRVPGFLPEALDRGAQLARVDGNCSDLGLRGKGSIRVRLKA